MTDLSDPLAPRLGKKSSDLLAAQLDVTTVGGLLRHYPRRYVNRGELTAIAGLEVGEHATLIAQVEKATLREMRARRGTMLQV
ncbi:ATP-dependent DNA helicase RecG, partial [Corallococcus praedator]